MDPNTEQSLLDRSCASALIRWATFYQKSGAWSNDVAYNAGQKFRRDLSRFRKPNYEDLYVPAAYIIHYQLGHIYMAKVALELLNQSREPDQKFIRIVDFGAGASACRIATTLMVAESLERGKTIDNIYIVEVDESRFMQSMGEIVWQAFVGIVLTEFTNSPLAHAVENIDSIQVSHWRRVLAIKTYTWLTAFHAIYPDTYDMRTEAAQIFNHVSPTMGVFTCHSRKLGNMRRAFPFRNRREWDDGFYPKFIPGPDGKVFPPSFHLAEQAKRLGFRNRIWRPFLQAKDCAILWGSENPF